ncbi:MAG: heparinase [Chloroflexi bacterium]|nr:MAG: heparinase [Chloroflexota bacterium]
MQKLVFLFHSVRYLRPIQLWGRLMTVMRRQAFGRLPSYQRKYRCDNSKIEVYTRLHLSKTLSHTVSLEDLEGGTFTFLNRRVSLGNPVDWFPQQESQLWRYNLHYFDYVESLAASYHETGNVRPYQIFRRLACEWIDSCPLATPLAWDPYPTSLRISNWIKAYTWFAPALCEDKQFATELRQSLFVQARFLEDNLEYHLLGNHLIENGRALLFAGLFFSGPVANRWRRKGEQILWRELHEQVLDDGGHYERSPMYHQMMLNLYQEVVTVLEARGDAPPEYVQRKIKAMGDWLRTLLHPDGEIPLLNDAALRLAGPLHDLQSHPGTVEDGLYALPKSGYFVLRGQRAGNFLVFDCGPLGPDYQPGHGHCDTLSFELSLAGQRFIVDSGVGNYYGDLEWRTYYRSTRAHNTVVVDDAEQSEIWGRFRVGRRAAPLDVWWFDDKKRLAYVSGGHDGYSRLVGNVYHHRWLCWIDRRFWLICDRITGQGSHRVESLLHFHPAVQVMQTPLANAQTPQGTVQRGVDQLTVVPWGVQDVVSYHGVVHPIQGWYAPEFGLQKKNTVWGLRREGVLPLWLGYGLWPGQANVAIHSSSYDEHHCTVIVQCAEAIYSVTCTVAEVSVEKKP